MFKKSLLDDSSTEFAQTGLSSKDEDAISTDPLMGDDAFTTGHQGAPVTVSPNIENRSTFLEKKMFHRNRMVQ